MATIQCPAIVETDATGAVHCVDGTSAAVPWVVVAEFDVADLDSVQLAQAFGAGFILVATCFVVGRTVKALVDVLR